MMRCKICNKQFHYCTNCGLDRELYPLSEGYCSEEHLLLDGGVSFDKLDAVMDMSTEKDTNA